MNSKPSHSQADNQNYVAKTKQQLGALIDVEDDLLDLYTLLALVKGADTTWKDVHDAWAIWRNHTAPNHKSLIPFDQLTLEVQQLDDEYTQAIIQVSGLVENEPLASQDVAKKPTPTAPTSVNREEE